MDVHELQIIIGGHIRELRQAHGWSQAELALHAKVSADFVSRAERGRRAPSTPSLCRLAFVLGVQPHELLAPAVPTSGTAPRVSAMRRAVDQLLDDRPDEQLRVVAELARVVFKALPGDDASSSRVGKRAAGRRTP